MKFLAEPSKHFSFFSPSIRFSFSNYTNSYSNKVNIIKLFLFMLRVCVCFCVLNMIWWNFFFSSFFPLSILCFLFSSRQVQEKIKTMFVSCCLVDSRKRQFSFDDESLSQQGWWLLFKLNCIPLDLTVKLYPLRRQIQI